MIRSFGFGAVLVAVLLVAVWWTERGAPGNPAVEPSAVPATQHPPSLRERLQVRRSAADERREARALALRLNKSLGVLFVRAVRIEGSTLALTIDGSIWDNETDADRAAIQGQIRTEWIDLHGKYGKRGTPAGLRLIDLDGTDIGGDRP